MPRTKGSKNKPKTVTADFASQIAEKQAVKDELNIPLRRSRLSGKMETTCPDRRKPL